MLRLLVAHPVLASGLDEASLAALGWSAPDGGAMLRQLVATVASLPGQPGFAALAEVLGRQDADFDGLVAEIAAEPESDLELARLELAGAVRQTTMKMLKAEQDQLAAGGLATEEARQRYRDIAAQIERLRFAAAKEAGN